MKPIHRIFFRFPNKNGYVLFKPVKNGEVSHGPHGCGLS